LLAIPAPLTLSGSETKGFYRGRDVTLIGSKLHMSMSKRLFS